MKDIICSNIGHTYESQGRKVPALFGIDLCVRRGKFVCLVGPSGCGKSTILKIILQLMLPSSGTIHVDPMRQRAGVAYVPQSANLLPWRSALQNAYLGIELRRDRAGEVTTTASLEHLRGTFREFGLGSFEHAKWSELSGGMRQKVALICALESRPSILVCDEPFSAIDFVSRLDLLNIFKKRCLDLQVTTVFVTHNIEEAIFLGDEIVVLSGSPGRLRSHYDVQLNENALDSVECRKGKRFQELFHQVWQDLRPK